MEPVGFAFGTVQAVTSCVTIGNVLIDTYRSYTGANQELEELQIRITHQWYKIQPSLKFLSSVYPSLETDHQEHLDSIVKTLQYKLDTAVTNISRVKKRRGSLRKFKYAVVVKSQLLHDLEELEKWQSRLEPSMFLITRTKTESVDQRIEESTRDIVSTENSDKGVVRQLTVIRDLRRVAKAPAGYNNLLVELRISSRDVVGSKKPIYFSSAQTWVIHQHGERVPVIVNSLVPGSRMDLREFEQDVYELIKILSKSEPMTFGMLRCRGYIPRSPPNPPAYQPYGSNNTAPHQFDLFFDYPGALANPKSLRSILIDAAAASAPGAHARPRYTLSARIRLAKQLARSVMFVHTCGMVHKNIRPECVLVFQDSADTPSLHRTRSAPHQQNPHPYQQHGRLPSLSSLSIDSTSTITPELQSLGTPFLVGFERTRRSSTATLLSPPLPTPRAPSPAVFPFNAPSAIPTAPASPLFDPQDEKWHRALYHHPRRQGIHPEERYSIEHDMYSLGVCLLEIGLWSSFVTRSEAGNQNVVGPVLLEEGLADVVTGGRMGDVTTVKPGAGPMRGGYYPPATPTIIPGAQQQPPWDARERADAVKQALIQVAKTRLPAVVGEKYRDVVVTCLEGFEADEGEDVPGGAGGGRSPSPLGFIEQDGAGAKVGLLFIEMVIQKLEEIAV